MAAAIPMPHAESQTLYINNLDDRKNPEALKNALHEICATFGELHEIVCMKSLKRRGQAWVVRVMFFGGIGFWFLGNGFWSRRRFWEMGFSSREKGFGLVYVLSNKILQRNYILQQNPILPPKKPGLQRS